jgi:hypothetical protein
VRRIFLAAVAVALIAFGYGIAPAIEALEPGKSGEPYIERCLNWHPPNERTRDQEKANEEAELWCIANRPQVEEEERGRTGKEEAKRQRRSIR